MPVGTDMGNTVLGIGSRVGHDTAVSVFRDHDKSLSRSSRGQDRKPLCMDIGILQAVDDHRSFGIIAHASQNIYSAPELPCTDCLGDRLASGDHGQTGSEQQIPLFWKLGNPDIDICIAVADDQDLFACAGRRGDAFSAMDHRMELDGTGFGNIMFLYGTD